MGDATEEFFARQDKITPTVPLVEEKLPDDSEALKVYVLRCEELTSMLEPKIQQLIGLVSDRNLWSQASNVDGYIYKFELRRYSFDETEFFDKPVFFYLNIREAWSRDPHFAFWKKRSRKIVHSYGFLKKPYTRTALFGRPRVRDDVEPKCRVEWKDFDMHSYGDSLLAKLDKLIPQLQSNS